MELQSAETERLEGRERRTWFFVGGAATGGLCALLVGFTDQAVPLISFAGILTVAVITAVSADARQSRQLVAEGERLVAQLDAETNRQEQRLAHERDRLNSELDAETNRHGQRLAHERDLAALDDLRDAIDTANILLRDQNLLVTQTIAAVELADSFPPLDALRTYIETEQSQAMLRSWSRLAVRRGPDTDLPAVYSRAIGGHRLVFRGLVELSEAPEPPTEAGMDAIRRAAHELYAVATEFERAAALVLAVGDPVLSPDPVATGVESAA